MKRVVSSLEDLTDSKELMMAREPDFIIIVLILIIILFLFLFVWMWTGEVDIVVRASGIVRPVKNISIIRNMYGGRIDMIYFEHGKLVQKGELLFKLQTVDLKEKKKNILNRISDINKQINSLSGLKDCIINGKSFNKGQPVYLNRYMLYKTKYEQLKISFVKAKDRYEREKMLSCHSTTKSELKRLRLNYKYAELNLNKFKKENINKINLEIDNYQEKLAQLRSQFVDIEKNIKLSCVKAPIKGTIEVIHKINSGDYIPKDLIIAKIIPETEVDYKMLITVKNRDISKLKKGQDIKYRFISLPYREYGVLNGEITKISSDASLLEDNESKLDYKIEATIEDIRMVSKSGKIKYIKTGMLSEVRIVTGRKKILYYVLEKLDFIT